MNRRPTCRPLLLRGRYCRSLLFLSLLLISISGIQPVQGSAFTPHADPTELVAAAPQATAPPAEIAYLLGAYSPNTSIVWHDGALWFIRPPYQSRLVQAQDGTYRFTEGWLAGRPMQFAPNDVGGISVLLQADDGSWNEFARSGEIYPDLSPDLRRELENLLERAADAPDVPGALMYAHVPGQGIWMGARGVADRGQGIPMVPLDRFRIASVTKPFVATVVLQLMQEGWLTLDDTVERWLPGMVPNGDRITLRFLLNHTSGLYNYLDSGFINVVLRDRAKIWSPAELVSVATAREPYFAPGEPGRWRYSNTNYILLGMVVERATGNPLNYEVRQRIIQPLGLYNTYFDPYENLPGGPVRGYVAERDYTDLNLSFAWAAGGMVSTGEDLGKFAQALYGGALLGPEALATMLTLVNTQGAWDTTDLGYGMGMMQDLLRIQHADPHAAGVAWGHTGGLIGYRTVMWFLPQTGVTVVVHLNQMYADPNPFATEAVDAIYRHYPWLVQTQ